MSIISNISQLIATFWYPQRIAGIEVLQKDDEHCFILTVLQRKKDQITIVDQQVVTELSDLKVSTPVYLCINTKDILHKRLVTGTKNNNESLQQSLPSVNLEDFYIQYFQNDHIAVASLIRTQVVEDYLKKLNEQKIYPLQLYLAPFTLENVFPFLKEESVDANRFQLNNVQGQIYSFRNNSSEQATTYQIGDEHVSSSSLLSYACALNHFIATDAIHTSSTPYTQQRSEGLHRYRFKRLSIAILSFLFSILLVNFFLFSSRRTYFSELQTKNKGTQQLVTKMTRLKKDFDRKQEFLSQAGWLDASMSSKCIDRIAKTVPSSVLLTSLSYHPINIEKSRKERRDIFDYHIILLKGNCQKPTVLNKWLQQLEELSFSKEVKVNDYHDDERSKKGEFEILIHL